MKKRVVLATGGTGGHIFPAISLYESLIKEGFKPYMLVDDRFLNYTKFFKSQVNYKVISSDKMSGGIFRKLIGALKLAIGLLQSIIFLLRYKPKLVIGFGGYMTFPIIIAAKILGKKIILHEQNSVLGNANKMLSPFAEFVATTFPSVKNLPPEKTLYVGNFLRAEFKESKKVNLPDFDKVINITVIGGSQGAKILGEIVPEALVSFAKKNKKKLCIFHQARKEDIDSVTGIYNKNNLENEVKPFFDDVYEKMKMSHIVIARSGASTITDLMAVGRAAIFIPIPYSFGNHQLLNAKYVCDNNASWLLEQKDLNVADLSEMLTKIFSNTNLLIEYSNNIFRLNKDGVSIIMPKIREFCA